MFAGAALAAIVCAAWSGMFSRGGAVRAAAVAADPPAATAPAVEPWADKRLPVTAGLEVWLDASRENAARAALKAPNAAGGNELSIAASSVAVWHDGSGHRRDLAQKVAAAQPHYSVQQDAGVMRFDGIDDALALPKWGADFDELTIFLVAAPQRNGGGFPALLALNRDNANDFQSGLTLDFGPAASDKFNFLNVEGSGFGGAANLLRGEYALGAPHVFTVDAKAGAGGVRLFVDGQAAGSRDRAAAALRADRLTVGARFYNLFGAPDTRGFGEADIAEILLYNRRLADADRRAVEGYLAAKYKRLAAAHIERQPLAGGGHRLQSVKSAEVQMLRPGFAARRLPLDLPNINNVQYRRDGKLVALAYNGNVYLLTDTNGDGLEDRAELYWESRGRLQGAIGMALTPPKYAHGAGVIAAGKGKILLLVDDNGDDRADREVVVASGWQELPHGVDALGVAIDPRDGAVFFGLGTQNFTNGYLLDDKGKAQYKLDSERGTILRVAPDFSKREIYCTGIRFSVGMAFNRDGDLFCTDQEGATWLPNGNPFDELLHIVRGRHYGFPPRHPTHLPNVIDEPSTFDYAPQHQSTCGLHFNEPVVDGGPTFGPAAWRGDAIVCGYSRGKIYRTKLVKASGEYVARSELIASLPMLTVDACVSPKGALLVSTHSGGPDWGSGPAGNGKLYQIRYADSAAPQPVLAWAASPREVHVAFDRPLDVALLAGLAAKTRVEYGRYVAAGDRFETQRPGYAVVEHQQNTPRFDLPIYSVNLSADHRTLIFATAEHTQGDATYALTLPLLHARKAAEPGDVAQEPQVDLQYDLTGVVATWRPADQSPAKIIWLPHIDIEVARKLTAGSAEHDAFWHAVEAAGELTLDGRFKLKNLLRPAFQPGATADYELPPEAVNVTASTAQPGAAIHLSSEPRGLIQALETPRGVQMRFAPVTHELTDLQISVKKPMGSPSLRIGFSAIANEREQRIDSLSQTLARPRPFALTRTLQPWASMTASAKLAAPLTRPKELDGGSWARGRRVFFSDAALCSKCHALDGQGGAVGPNLSNLRQRDYTSVLRDVSDPSFAVNPDYIAYSVLLEDGRVLTGTLRTEGEKLAISDERGDVTRVAKEEVASVKPSAVSIMPKGMPEKLGPAALRDLLTFLLVPPPSMPLDSPLPPPAPRSPDELRAVLAGAPQPPEKTRKLKVVLVAGPKDHGPGEHDYPAWQKVWSELLAIDEQTEVSTAWEWPSAEQLAKADAFVFFQHGSFDAQRAKDTDALLARGAGLTFIHWAVDGGKDSEAFAARIGLAGAGAVAFRHGPLDLDLSAAKHPITRNFERIKLVDESYWKMRGDAAKLNLLGTSIEEGAATPQMWTRESGRGRIFVSIPGHFNWSFDDPLFRVLLLRGIAWTAHEPVDRYNELAPIGARMRR
jgi:putative heme-binding domain-containing protein